MTGAMYAAIAGMKTHMNKLSVIGNNIANVNTNGYKTQRTVFRDALYTMYSSGSDGTATVGGKNPAQIGYGSQVASIDLNMTTSNFAPGNPMDCMLYGDGFFLVGDKDVANVIDPTDPSSLKSLTLTRVGDFQFGPDGYLVDGNGSTVYGFLTVGTDPDGKPIVSDQLVPIRLPRVESVAVNTETGEIIENFDPDNPPADIEWEYRTIVRYPVAAKDDQGAPVSGSDLLNPDVTSSRLEDYWPVDDQGNKVGDTNPLAFAQIDSITIDRASGQITATLKDTDEQISIGFLAVGNVTNPNGVSQTVGGGMLEHVNGSLAPVDANGDPVDLSDKARIGSAGTTKLYTGGLETSNVDLATEISEMITTQRGYQANTRIVTVTDSMLEELVNMKR